jgi:hypothetical protein
MDATYKESLLIIGIGALSTGIEKIDANITVGIVLVLVGAGILGLRGYLKLR